MRFSAGNSSGSFLTAAFTAPTAFLTMLEEASQYSAVSASTLSSAMPGVSRPSGNQTLSIGEYSSSIRARSWTIVARPATETQVLSLSSAKATLTAGSG